MAMYSGFEELNTRFVLTDEDGIYRINSFNINEISTSLDILGGLHRLPPVDSISGNMVVTLSEEELRSLPRLRPLSKGYIVISRRDSTFRIDVLFVSVRLSIRSYSCDSTAYYLYDIKFVANSPYYSHTSSCCPSTTSQEEGVFLRSEEVIASHIMDAFEVPKECRKNHLSSRPNRRRNFAVAHGSNLF